MPVNEYQKMLNDARMMISQVYVCGDSVDFLAAARSTLAKLYTALGNAVPKSDTPKDKPVPDLDTGSEEGEYGG